MWVTVSVTAVFITAILVLDLLAAGVAAIFGRSFRKFFLGGLRALLVPVIVLFYGMFIGRNHYVVNELEIVSRDVPESFDGYRIVQISDLHLESFGSRSRSLARAVSKVNALNPDLILFTGDLVTSHPSEMDGLEHVLSGLEAKDGICSVLGNHDYCIYRRWESDSLRAAAVRELVAREESLGWHVLMNSCVNIVRPRSGISSGAVSESVSASSSAPDSVFMPAAADTISVAGVENISQTSYFPSYGDLDKAMADAADSFRILMTHDPTHWHKAISQYPDIDLTLSGHTHAMQFSIFGWSPSSLIFDEYRGLYIKTPGGQVSSSRHRTSVSSDSGNLLYVNIGLGETAIPSRFGAAPEITLFTLRHSE